MNNLKQPKILLKPRDTDLLPISASSNMVAKKNQTVLTPTAPGISTIKERPTSVINTSVKSIEHKYAPAAAAAPDPSVFNQTMGSSLTLIRNQNAFNYRVLDFLHETNQDYIVVGVVGAQAVGKSTLLNMLNQHLFIKDPTKRKNTNTVFPVHDKINIFGENEVKIFITQDRLILLDYTEPLIGQIRKDFIQHEQEDLKRMLLLLKICHVLLIVQEEYYNIRIIRSLVCAKMMSQNIGPTKFVFVRNKVIVHSSTASVARTLMLQMYQRIFNESICHDLEHDASNIKQEAISYVEIPFLEKGSTMQHNEHLKRALFYLRKCIFSCRVIVVSKNCSEKAWGHALLKLMDNPESNFFLDKYEKLKEKYNLHNHVKIADNL
ncbi:protein SMG9-like [Anopheles albimanus]|uniref:protein SMG9-like n=1 Tax=Anopheles albimanus TaxID=7167 RepID=UPI001641AA75|nr:protein SMG9-like [Anopheles albimanus]